MLYGRRFGLNLKKKKIAFKRLVYLFMYSFTYKLCKLLFHVYLIKNLFN